MRRGVLVGSIAVHVALAALLYGVARRDPAPRPPRPPIDIEIAARVEPEPRVESEASAGARVASDRSTARPAAAPAATAAPAHRRSVARPVVSASAAPAPGRLAITGYDRADSGGGSDGDGDGDGGSDGAGLGAGGGGGTGAGLGALAVLPPPPSPPPPPPLVAEKPPSKARPPRLVYPKRDREGDEAETFVARLTVDTDGYVVGARLVRGVGGPRDELASQLVWRFRYAPALDDAGRAIRATIDQRFLVGH